MSDSIFETLEYYYASNDFNITTTAILTMQSKISAWLSNGTTGAIIYGRPRIGKTRAILYISNSLKIKYGKELPIYVLNATIHTPTDKFFYSELLKIVGHPEFDKGTATALKERLINALTMSALGTKSKKIILFIDEAYNFTEKDFRWLMDVYNNLNLRDIHLTVFLVGSDELKALKSGFVIGHQHQIVGRFMVEEYHFRGITSAKDMAVCLMNFDKPIKYENGVVILTEQYFPDAYKENKRLIDCSEMLMELYLEIMREMNIPLNSDIPMMYFINAVRYCVNEYGIQKKNIYFPDRAAWKDSILNSGYIAAERILYENPVN